MIGGHGHVKPRQDGMLARCGGPGICPACSREAVAAAEPGVAPEITPSCACPAAARLGVEKWSCIVHGSRP